MQTDLDMLQTVFLARTDLGTCACYTGRTAHAQPRSNPAALVLLEIPVSLPFWPGGLPRSGLPAPETEACVRCTTSTLTMGLTDALGKYGQHWGAFWGRTARACCRALCIDKEV